MIHSLSVSLCSSVWIMMMMTIRLFFLWIIHPSVIINSSSCRDWSEYYLICPVELTKTSNWSQHSRSHLLFMISDDYEGDYSNIIIRMEMRTYIWSKSRCSGRNRPLTTSSNSSLIRFCIILYSVICSDLLLNFTVARSFHFCNSSSLHFTSILFYFSYFTSTALALYYIHCTVHLFDHTRLGTCLQIISSVIHAISRYINSMQLLLFYARQRTLFSSCFCFTCTHTHT